MKSRLGHLWAHHKFLFLSFALALVVTVFFILRTVVFFVYWSDPAHRNQPLEPWMTPRYIGNSYELPPEEILQMLNVQEPERIRPTLDWIARQKGISTHELIADLTRQLDAQND
jgi:hypothetical protein